MTAELHELLKAAGSVVAIAKAVVDHGACGIDEHSFVELVTMQAKREHPSMSAAQAFAKAFTARTADGEMLRRAHAVVKAAPFEQGRDDDAEAAIAELQKIGDQRWPSLQKHQRFARAMECNVVLAKRALKHPIARTSFPFPKF